MRGGPTVRVLRTALVALLVPIAPGAANEEPEGVPFPCARSTILREEKVIYTVEGRVRIPKGVTVSVQKDVHIRSRGAEPAVIEVEGALEVHGVADREVIFEGVSVEPQESFDQIQLDSVEFRGGGVQTPPERAVNGRMRIEHARFTGGAKLELLLGKITFDLFDTTAQTVTKLVGTGADKGRDGAKVAIRQCTLPGLIARDLADLTVRTNRISAGPVHFADVRKLIFDANKVEAVSLLFEQSAAGGFNGTEFMKCDLYCDRIEFKVPYAKGRTDRVEIDKCWFEGRTDRATLESIVVDRADDPKCNAEVSVRNPLERPLELAGAVNR